MWELYEKEHIKYVYEVLEFIDYRPRTIGVFEKLTDAESCADWYQMHSLVVIERKKKIAVVVLSRYDHCPSVELPLGKNEYGEIPLLNGFEWNVYGNIDVGNNDYPYGKRIVIGQRSYKDAVKRIKELGYSVRNENTSEALMEATMLHCLENKDDLDKWNLDQEKYYNKDYKSHK